MRISDWSSDVCSSDLANGVQLMKPNPGLDTLLHRAKALGVFGTKERSVINLANREGIAAVVRQQFEVGQQVLAAGLVPILAPEVNITSPERADRKSGVWGKSGSGRVDHGGRRVTK